MGFAPRAKLIFGIQMPEPYDSYTGEVRDGFDEEIGEWEFESDILEVAYYGHYDDPEGPRGILTIKSLPRFHGDAWTPEAVHFSDLAVSADVLKEAAVEAQRLGFTFVDTKWWLVASYG